MNEIANTEPTWTPHQLDIIRKTYAKGATEQEFEIFLYKCRHLGMDPIKNQIYFVKYNNSPGMVIIGIDGFRSRAAKTGKHSGTERGVLKDKDGKVTHGWCKVHRSDWTHPAYEESSMAEYNTGKGMWTKMPETMIKKVAEVAALKMAFSDEMSGFDNEDEITADDEAKALKKSEANERAMTIVGPRIKDLEEVDRKTKLLAEQKLMEKAQKEVLNHATGEVVNVPVIDGSESGVVMSWKVPFGKFTGKTLHEIGLEQAKFYRDWLKKNAEDKKKPLDGHSLSFCINVDEWELKVQSNSLPIT